MVSFFYPTFLFYLFIRYLFSSIYITSLCKKCRIIIFSLLQKLCIPQHLHPHFHVQAVIDDGVTNVHG